MECLTSTKSGAEILLEYGSGTLEPGKAVEIDRHIENCESCRRLVAAQRDVWERLGQWTAPAVSTDFNARLYARIAKENQAPRWRHWMQQWTRPALPYALWKPAAVAAACAALAVALLVHEPRATETNPHSAQMEGGRVDIEQVANTLDEMDVLMPAPSSSSAM